MILVLAMTSALAVGGAFVARQVAANARVLERGATLEPLAESALVAAVAAWDSVARDEQVIGSSVSGTTTNAESADCQLAITRLTASLYWLVAEAQTTSRPRLRRRLGLLVRVTAGVPQAVPQRAWAELP
jgi:hypothetical protein